MLMQAHISQQAGKPSKNWKMFSLQTIPVFVDKSPTVAMVYNIEPKSRTRLSNLISKYWWEKVFFFVNLILSSFVGTHFISWCQLQIIEDGQENESN